VEAAAYIRQVNVMDKAGAYAIQEHGEMLGARWEGELENIIGLPLLKLEEVLKKYSLKSD
jgi:septum formation protein